MLTYQATYTENGAAFYTEKTSSVIDEKLHYEPFATLYELAFEKNVDCDVSIKFLIEIAKNVISEIAHNPDIEILRMAPEPRQEILHSLIRSVPYTNGWEFVNAIWLKILWKKISSTFNTEIANFKGTVEEYFRKKDKNLIISGRIFFHLVENKDGEEPFAFLATYSTGTKDDVKHFPLRNALEEYKDQNDLIKLLTSINKVAAKSSFMSEIIENGELFSPLKFSAKEAYLFLTEAPIYEECGIGCRIPNFWKKKYKASLKISIKEPAKLGLNEIMSFSPEIYLGDEKFSLEEIKKFLSETDGLAFLKGKWVELDKQKLNKILDAYNKVKNKDITLLEALQIDSKLDTLNIENTDFDVEISNEKWFSDLKEKMLNPAKAKKEKVPKTFNAVLRHYQEVGFNWLNFMNKNGFGALLADDMGLGKTVQMLALLDLLRANKTKTLLIIPASLITNWKRETEKFAPKIKLQILHGKKTSFALKDADLFITTYGMAMRLEGLKKIDWDLLILDEAQAIKNNGSKQTKAIKQITAKSKIAMTGTPIENGLSDLWSVFDFLNKGMLFSQKQFTEFARNLEKKSQGYEKLRNIVSPFILRRLKTDKKIISDLPDKIESKQFVSLSSRQVALYKGLVDSLAEKLEDKNIDGIQRKGLVLSSIMKLKQICNHPAQYLDNGDFAAKHSGKFEMLSEICETICEKRERALIFTQFKEMTEPLNNFLEKVFNKKGLVLHGSTSVKSRGELVEKFNGQEYVPYMVLSLKAGGVGLNLTAANHIVHFDRWWNPAAENQATDRAFRIGQTKNVNVYKFISSGTVEDKIDSILESKQNLADEIIAESSGEKMLTEMSNKELLNILKLEEAV
ncbi:MAG: DEAD/DEAH box helicase [Fibromonadaceae bacterium]|jgi:non-specific serine/threonine protein kinase|nr:DEAD/DEAH box helicase [Fibromonadaceae bacterium]